MKILFYEIKDKELDYLLEKIPSNLEPYYFKSPLNSDFYMDDEFFEAQAISTFINSDLTGEVLAKFKNLRFIFLRCTGYSNVDLKYCKENNIFVFNIADYGSSSVAEYTFSLILSLVKKIPSTCNHLKNGEISYNEIENTELKGKTLGIIGLGTIGRKIAKIAQGFSMDVIAYDNNPKGDFNFSGFDSLLENSDIIVIACALSEQNYHLINRDAFLKMKQTAFIINIARGEIIDTGALYCALSEKRIQGAALDVVECEEFLCKNYDLCKIKDNYKTECLRKFLFTQKLMQMDNVIITPHNAYNTREANKRILDITFENIENNITKTNIEAGTKNLVLI